MSNASISSQISRVLVELAGIQMNCRSKVLFRSHNYIAIEERYSVSKRKLFTFCLFKILCIMRA